jgi:hypothetical protein
MQVYKNLAPMSNKHMPRVSKVKGYIEDTMQYCFFFCFYSFKKAVQRTEKHGRNFSITFGCRLAGAGGGWVSGK